MTFGEKKGFGEDLIAKNYFMQGWDLASLKLWEEGNEKIESQRVL